MRLGGLLGVMLLLLAGPPPEAKTAARMHPARDQTVPETYFGMHIHRAVPKPGDPTSTPWPSVAFGAWRLWDARVGWPWLEPRPGEWDFALLDRYVALAESAHVEVLLPLGLSPAWASARPAEHSAYGPGNASEPSEMQSWEEYVETVATRYRGRIQAYEIWNEPNLPGFFTGQVEDMVRLAEAAYVQIKRIDPQAVVVSPAPAGAGGLGWMEFYVGAGGMKWADVIGYHFYGGRNDPPEVMTRLMQKVREVIDGHGLPALPIWNTETGWRIEGKQAPPTPFKASEEAGALADTLAAAYVARALVIGWACGLERFYWYSWDNYTMGLVESDGSTPKPAATAFATVRSWLLGARVTNVTERPDGTWLVQIRREDHQRALIVWNTHGPTRFTAPPFLRHASTCDLVGYRRPLPAEASRKGILIGASPILIGRSDDR